VSTAARSTAPDSSRASIAAVHARALPIGYLSRPLVTSSSVCGSAKCSNAREGALVPALAFVVRRDAQNYAGKLSEAEILAVFERGSCGRFGTSLEYLTKTVSSLRENGLRDPHLEKLARHADTQVPKIKP
jgi:cation transport regulator ChaC